MQTLSSIITALKAELKKIEGREQIKLEALHKRLQSIESEAIIFQDLWEGGWAQENYNYYQNPDISDQIVEINSEHIFARILSRTTVNVKTLSAEISEYLIQVKKIQQIIVTELSIIRGQDKYIHELELLTSIETFKWGFEITDIIRMSTPNQLLIYDYEVLSKGIKTPPHVEAIAFITSFLTKAFSITKFVELVTRILRQLEIKLGTPNLVEVETYSAQILENIYNNFHHFCNQLKNRYSNRSTIEVVDEYDVQDLLHSILRLHFSNIKAEESVPSYAGSNTRADFVLKNENIVIEVKKTRKGLADKEIGAQLILDAAYYSNYPECRTLHCFVFDPEGRIKNPRGLEDELTKLSNDRIIVTLFIRP